jgi:phasin family protein
MFATFEQFAAFNKASVDAMLSLANAGLYSAERIAALKLHTARIMLEDGAASTKALLDAKDLQEVIALQTAQTHPALEQIAAFNRSWYEIFSQSKDEVSKLLESQFGEFQKQVSGFLDKATKNGPAGSEVAINAVKSTFSIVNSAFDNMNNAVKQAGEIAEANINTASEATINTARSVNTSKKKTA